ncbi:MAG: leucyl/phenylalanyl-tRNA--protein transferase [Aureispira sp.]|nr:leucyl/phenylalanyl-tRNA--protein transferase [Aureispira sp.]
MYWLSKDLVFPHPKYADEDGVLAVGGDLSIERLLLAYENGIFPWYNEGEPIVWWAPDPRFVLFPSEISVSKSMRKIIRRKTFEVRYDTAFEQVIEACSSTPRLGQSGTWLIPEMIEAYIQLHQLGLAHSVETWQDGELVGGLYGVSLGKCFFGESMFSHRSNASKTALIHLAQTLDKQNYSLIDCQVHTPHVESMGARLIPRQEFTNYLEKNKKEPTKQESWSHFATI